MKSAALFYKIILFLYYNLASIRFDWYNDIKSIFGGFLMKRKVLVFTTVVLLSMFLATTAFGAQATTRNLKAYFRGIKIKVNNQVKSTQNEPFIYNNVVYVPIRFVSEALGKFVHWDDKQNTVIINDTGGASSEEVAKLKQEIQQKDQEITRLANQNTYLNFRVSELEKALLDSGSRSDRDRDIDKDLEDYLYDEYSRWNKIKFDYKVRENSKGDITLTIEFDRRDYKSEWDDLTERKIERWLEDIYDYVQDEYSDPKFEGTIRDTDERETLVEFYESRGKLEVEFKSSKSKSSDLERDLEDKYGRDLKSYSSKFGKMRVDFEVDVDEDDEEINITMRIDTDKYEDEWDNIKETRAAEDWIEDIVKYCQDEYRRYTVYGKIRREDRNRTLMTFEANSRGNVTYNW